MQWRSKHVFLFQFQAAAKVLAEAEKLTGKSAESSDVDEPQQTVFIDAPPPKVNVWLKKSDNSAQAVWFIRHKCQTNGNSKENKKQKR